MVNLENLHRDGLRAYEIGRLRTAARVAMLLVPLSALCWFVTDRRGACACLGFVVLGLAIWLRWKDRQGGDDVRAGLQAGIFPLAVGLGLSRLAPGCPFPHFAPFCSALGLVAGLCAGIWIAVKQTRRAARARNWLAAIATGVLLGSLGCLQLGLSSLLGVAIGIVAGCGAGAWFERRPA